MSDFCDKREQKQSFTLIMPSAAKIMPSGDNKVVLLPFQGECYVEYCTPKAMPLGYELGGLSARMDVCEYRNFKVMLNL